MKLLACIAAVLTLLGASVGAGEPANHVTIKDAAIQLELPLGAWSVPEKREKYGVQIWFSNRSCEDGTKCVAMFTLQVNSLKGERNSDTLQLYSESRQDAAPFTVEEKFTWQSGRLQHRNAIAYKGNLLIGNIPTTMYRVHLLEGRRAIEISIASPTDTFAEFDQEFRAILLSIRSLKKVRAISGLEYRPRRRPGRG